MNFEWRITGVKVKPQQDGKQNLVHNVQFACIAKEGPWRYDYCSEANIEYVPSSDFTPYEQLSQDKMLEWVFANIVKADYEAELQSMYNNWVAKQAETPPLPWAPK